MHLRKYGRGTHIVKYSINYKVEAMESLDEVAALSDQKQKIEQYRAALQKVLQNGSTEQCKEFVDHSAFQILWKAIGPP